MMFGFRFVGICAGKVKEASAQPDNVARKDLLSIMLFLMSYVELSITALGYSILNVMTLYYTPMRYDYNGFIEFDMYILVKCQKI